MKLWYVFTNDMHKVRRLICIHLIRVANYSKIVDKCIKPHVHCLIVIPRNLDAPMNPVCGPTYRNLRFPLVNFLKQLCPYIIRDNTATWNPFFDWLSHLIIDLEDIVLLFYQLQSLASVSLEITNFVFDQVFIWYEAFLIYRVITFVLSFRDVSFWNKEFPELTYCSMMIS